MKPPLIVLAGPNGAGKSTFHEAFLSSLGLPFLNADRLAAETGMDHRLPGLLIYGSPTLFGESWSDGFSRSRGETSIFANG